jgi:uncharacterized protein DUF2183
MKTSYPLSIQDDRHLPQGYDGPVYVWDIDKTYLSTPFSSLRGLIRIPFELAVDKRAIPGMPEILRGLRRGVGPEVACLPLYFISASPHFLRGVIESKMLRDGVEQDGIIFKDWFQILLSLHPGRLFEQVGFKMIALLVSRLRRVMCREYLFGDDTEKDAEIFSLYARLINGKISASMLEEELTRMGVPPEDRREIHRLISWLPLHRGRVEKIYVHLERRTPPAAFEKFGPLIEPVKGAYQMALGLWNRSLIDSEAVRAVRRAVLQVPQDSYGDIRALDRDALRRGLIVRRLLKKLKET